MKKVLFLTILPFLLLGTARVSAQVRIGGSGTPHSAAVLDLNVDDEQTPSGNRGGLALPRVVLTSNNMDLNGAAPVNGMLVYHTGSSLDGAGVYIWMTDKWVKASTGSVAYTGSTSIALDGDSIVRKALTGDVTADENSNETTIGNGTVTSAKILDNTITANDIADNAIGKAAIADGAIENSKLADASVDSRKLNGMGATAGQHLAFDGVNWAPVSPAGTIGSPGGGRLSSFVRDAGQPFVLPDTLTWYYPYVCTTGGRQLHLVGSMGRVTTNYVAMDLGATVYTPDGKVLCDSAVRCRCFFVTF